MKKILTVLGLSAIVAGFLATPAEAGVRVDIGVGGYYAPAPHPYAYGPAYYGGYYGPTQVYYAAGYYPWYHGYWHGGYHHRWYFGREHRY
jgi:hypothetical protein